MANQPGLTEYCMAYSDRNGVEELSGPMADARRIQNVLFGHGRAGDYDLGIDIQSYLQEPSDAQTLMEIRQQIERAVAKHLPGVKILEVAVDTLPADQDLSGRRNASLIVGFSLGRGDGGKFDFAILARRDSMKNVVSSLVL